MLAEFYRKQLEEQILPFWLKHSPDRECGGYATCLDRTGRVYDADKLCMWSQGRIAWTFAHLYNELRPEPAWLDMARLGVDFIRRHGFGPDGRMYYALRRDGRPLAGPSDVHAELSSVVGMTELARATRDEALYGEARALFDRVWTVIQDPQGFWNPQPAAAGSLRVHGHSMITINVLQQLRQFREERTDARRIDVCIAAMRDCHLRPKKNLLLEMTGWQGEDLPGSAGRRINPGHMIEGGIFLIHESHFRGDAALRDLGLDLIRWGFELGWDKEYGGIFNDVDSEGLPIVGRDGVVADCKLWWQHAEGLYGLLLAFAESNDAWFHDAYRKLHLYCFSRFADPEHGEWYAFLDRTGRPIHRAKGSDRKSCFHIGRNFFWCAQLSAAKEIPVPS